MTAHLAGTFLMTLAAEIADPERFRRGRVYARQHAVRDLRVSAGRATALVQGSRREPYAVEVRVAPAAAAQRAALAGSTGGPAGRYTAVVPRPHEVRFSCTCPDFGNPCKHSVAVLMELASAVGDDPELLVRWRDVGDLPFVPDEPDVALDDELDAFLSGGADPVVLRAVEPLPAPHHHDEASRVLADALAVLRSVLS